MSKHPSPRLDQLRALREANFARAEQLRKEAAKGARQPETTPPREQAPPDPTAEHAADKPAKATKPSNKPASGKADGKKAAAKKASKKKGKS